MKIQPLKDQLIGKRFWSSSNILYTIAYKENDIYYAVTYYRSIWVHRKYQRGLSYEKVFYKDFFTKENISEHINEGWWRKYENTSK